MKVIIGVDAGGGYRPGMDLFVRLGFTGAEVTVVSAVDTTPPIVPLGPGAPFVATDYVSQTDSAAHRAVAQAVESLEADGIKAESVVLFGAVVPVLLREASELKAELLVVNSVVRGKWMSAILGSVSNSLTNESESSVLVSKGESIPEGPLKAVFATDHSEYATRALEEFLKMAPMGLQQIHILTVYDIDELETKMVLRSLPDLQIDMKEWVAEQLTEKCQALATRLGESGYDVTFSVVAGDVNEQISNTMNEQAASLLILGAQGHGLIERVFTGSVALHQVVSEPYPVLLIRA